MTNTYKAVSEYGRAIFGDDVFDGDFDAAEEKDHLDGSHLEIVPRKYKVLSNNFTDGEMGSEYVAALPKGREDLLLQGGHLRRDDSPPATKPATKKTAEKPDKND